MTATKQRTCEERIDEQLASRVEDIENALAGKWDSDYEYEDLIEWINSYALCYEDDPHDRAKRLELSTGGPADGFKFFEDETIEYYFQDWGDGATRELDGKNYDTLKELYDQALNF